jgi:hypothetical protein
VRQSIALPTISIGNQAACTLTASAFAKEGFAARSADGAALVFGCYDAPVGTSGFQSTARRVIARIWANGQYDTSLAVAGAYILSCFA